MIAIYLKRCAARLRWPERSDFAVALPKLYVVTVNELLGIFFRDFIVLAHKLNRPDEVCLSQQCTHDIRPFALPVDKLCDHKNGFPSVRFRPRAIGMP